MIYSECSLAHQEEGLARETTVNVLDSRPFFPNKLGQEEAFYLLIKR